MKSRNLVGGAIVGALLVGIWFGSFFKGPGLGGSGTGTGDGEKTESLTNSRAEVRSGTETGASSPTASTGRTREPAGPEIGLPTQLITIVIHDNQFRLLTGDDPRQGHDLPLEEIRKQAADTVGTSEGIRIRVLKEKSAQEGARSDLLAALAEAGVKREEIQERAEFIK